eukprot:s3590_g15.t1
MISEANRIFDVSCLGPMQCRRNLTPWKSRLVRLKVLSEWHKATRRQFAHQAHVERKLARSKGAPSCVIGDDVGTTTARPHPNSLLAEACRDPPRSSPRLPPRSPLLKAMDSPITSVVRSHSSKRMVLMQLALLPMSFARAKARATSARSPLLKARTHRGGTTQAGASTRRLDVASEIRRILAATSPEEKLQVAANAAEEEILQAWKKLVLLLHPDKPAPQLSSIAGVFRGTNKSLSR